MTIAPQKGLAKALRESDNHGGAANSATVAPASIALANEIIQGMARGDLDPLALAALARNFHSSCKVNIGGTEVHGDNHTHTHTHTHNNYHSTGITQEKAQEMIDRLDSRNEKRTMQIKRFVQETAEDLRKQLLQLQTNQEEPKSQSHGHDPTEWLSKLDPETLTRFLKLDGDTRQMIQDKVDDVAAHKVKLERVLEYAELLIAKNEEERS